MTPDPKPLSAEEIEGIRAGGPGWCGPMAFDALCDMALATASRPAGEGLESVKGTLTWLRSVADRNETVRVDGKALGRVLAAYDDTLARQQAEIASLRERLEKAKDAAALWQAGCHSLKRGAAENMADAVEELQARQAAEARLAELQQAKLSVEEQNRGLIEENARFYDQATRSDERFEAMRRTVEGIAKHKTSDELAASMAQHFHCIDFAMRYDELIRTARALTAAQEGERCPRCEDWHRLGLSNHCPACDATALARAQGERTAP